MNTEQPKQPESVYQAQVSGEAAKAREVCHTIGPWRARIVGTTTDDNGNARHVGEVVAPSFEQIVDATYIEDARLIAAAPDLLGVAQMVLDEATDSTPPALIAYAQAAIARATGAAS